MDVNQGYVASNYDVRVTRQGSLSTGKKRYVWVDLDGAVPYPVYVPKGGLIQNVGKYGGKFFQGDLCQYSTDGKCYVLKTFELAKAVGSSDTAVLFKRGEFYHIPNADDVLMVAPTTLVGGGYAKKIGSPTATTATISGKSVDVWSIDITPNEFGTLAIGTIFVEAKSNVSTVKVALSGTASASGKVAITLDDGTAVELDVGNGKTAEEAAAIVAGGTYATGWTAVADGANVIFTKNAWGGTVTATYPTGITGVISMNQGMLVSNPNAFVDNDIVMNYSPATGNSDFDGARYMFTPILHQIAWKERMSPLPSCVDSINKSRVSTWFEL